VSHEQSGRELRRRQLVTVGVGVLGAVVLGCSLRVDPGSRWFYVFTLGLAGLWTVGAFASGPLHLGRVPGRQGRSRPVVTPIVVGLLLAGIFVAGAFLVRSLDFLDGLESQVVKVLDYADQGSTPLLVLVTVVSGIAEELFFRGAAYAAITVRPVLWTTAAYVVATAATGNVMLTFAALLLGLVLGLERQASGGILAPVLTHCTWSLAMLFVLPLVFS
jgi:uncharacterized protein